MIRPSSCFTAIAAASLVLGAAAHADEPATPPPPPPAAAPASPAATAPTSNAMTTPAMSFPLAANPNPLSVPVPVLGNIYITGVVSGLGLWQDNVFPGDHHALGDLSNGQVFIQNTTGPVQFFVQAGAYSLPALGTVYVHASRETDLTYDVVPQAFIKIVPFSNFSIEAGKLPTLIGAEYTFTFENANIERGLLWNQENAVNRGVQANYTIGPVALSASLNDGYYSNRYNWLWGSATWTINSSNTLSAIAGGNLGTTPTSTFATPLAQNNSSIYNLIYTYTSGPLTLQPYLQFNYVPKNAKLGFSKDASTFGAAIIANYAFSPMFSLAGRFEYIESNGSLAGGSPNLLYGPGSKAISFTVTPTFQYKIFFARLDVSFVKAYDITPGLALGPNGTSDTELRGVIEAGVNF